MRALSINTWNINEPFTARMAHLERYIAEQRPDIICMQEVTPVDGELPIGNLLNIHNYYFYFQKSGVYQKREEGLLIASRSPIVESNTHFLPYNPDGNDMQRSLLAARFSCWEDFVVYNTHLVYHQESQVERANQIESILKTIKKNSNAADRVLLCGDLNEDASANNVHSLIAKNKEPVLLDSWIESDTEPTFSSKNQYVVEALWPDRRIDYIFHSPNFNVTSKRCMFVEDGYELCSDHYGVIADISF